MAPPRRGQLSGAAAHARATFVIHGTRSGKPGTLTLSPSGETLRGRVVYADGETFTGRVVVVGEETFWRPLTRARGAQVVTVDVEGRFVVGGLPPGGVIVSALVPGTRRALDYVTLPRAEEYVLTIDAQGGAGSGRLLDARDRTPVAGAAVVMGYGLGPRADYRRTTTDDAGRFSLPVSEDVVLTVMAAGYAPLVTRVAVEANEPVEIHLRRAAHVTGRVLTESGGTPVPDIDVYALSLDPDAPLLLVVTARTNRDGRFTLEGVVPGSVAIFALGAGYASVGLNEGCTQGYNPLARTLAAGGREEIELRVRDAGHAVGRVTTTGGGAVAGAVVRVTWLPMLEALADLPGAGGASAVTDAEGRYRIETLVPGASTKLALAAAGYPHVISEGLRVDAGETRELDFVLARARWLELVVEGSDGRPIRGAVVRVAGGESEGGGLRVATTGLADAEGRTRLGPLPPGPVTVAVVAPAGYLDLEAWHDLQDSGGEGDVTARVTLEQGVPLSGRIVLPEGAPPTQVEAYVRGGASGRWVDKPLPIAADGSWHVEGLPGGANLVASATLTWEGRRWKGEVRTDAGASEVLLVLEPIAGGAHVVLRVLDPGGRPVPAGPVRMRAESASWASAHRASLSNGRAVFERTDPGAADTQLWFVLGPFPDGAVASVVVGPYDGASAEEIEIRLMPGRIVSGRVVDEAGTGVSGMHVGASPTRDDLPGGVRGQRGAAISGPDGDFEIRGLGGETYALEVDVPTRYLAPEPLLVEPPRSDVRLRLRNALQARVKVLDAAGAPLEGALVKLVFVYAPARSSEATAGAGPAAPPQPQPHHAEDVRMALTSASGVAVLAGLPPDLSPSRLEVLPPKNRPEFLAYRRERWIPTDETVRLARGLEVSGVVRDPAGAPVPEAVVEFRFPDEETWNVVAIGTDGSFQLRPLPRGDVELRGGVRAGAMNPSRRVPAGSANVVLTVDPGVSLGIRIEAFPGSAWRTAFLRASTAPRGQLDERCFDERGRIRFIGLRTETTYAVWVPKLEGGRCALAENLKPGAGEVVLTPQAGLVIEGSLELPPGAESEWRRLTADVAGFVVYGGVRPDGTFRIGGMPAGTWSLHASAGTGSEASWEGDARVASGSRDAVLRLTQAGE